MPEIDYSKYSPFTEREGQYLFGILDPTNLTVGESTIDRRDIVSSTTPVTSGNINLTFFTAAQFSTISQIRIGCAQIAAGATPTTVKLGVYKEDSVTKNLTLLGATVNDTSLFANTNTTYTKAFTAPFTIEPGSRYAVAILVISAAAMPSFKGNGIVLASESFQDPKLSALLTSQTDLPSSILNSSLSEHSNSIYSVIIP